MSARYHLRGKRNPEVDGFTSSNADTASTSDEPLPDPPTTQKAKRARTSPATSKVSHKKDLDSKKNVLCRLMELPVEIFTEIASLAQPGDLLSLARCCKGLREMLMTTSAAHIWHSAEGNVEGLPHCPEDMYEPQYAALLFTKLCTSCGKSTSSRADPFLRVRLCSECREIRLVEPDDSWKAGYPNLDLVPVTKLMKFKLKSAGRRMYGAGSTIEYCLVDEADELFSQQNRIKATHNAGSYENWRINLHSYIQKRHQASLLLEQFLWSVNRARSEEIKNLKMERRETIDGRLRELGWSDGDLDFRNSAVEDQWTVLLNQPKAINDRTWEKLLAQLAALLEAKQREPLEKAKEERKRERRKRIYTLLQELKSRINPFVHLLEDLGLDPSQPPNASEDGSAIPEELLSYPFLNYATVLEASCLDDVNNVDLSLEEVEELFYKRQDEIEGVITEWREQGEQRLVDFWKSADEEALNAITSNATETQTSNTDFLLRADTIFSRHSAGDPNGQRSPEHYPDLIREIRPYLDTEGYSVYQNPSKMVWTRFYRHVETEKITKAILGRHEMSDATYYGLKVLGAIFVCERCEDKEPKTWDDMLDHYIQEGKIWHRQSQSDPIIKTSVPIPLQNTHDTAVTLKPFIRLLEDGDEEGAIVPQTLNLNKTLDCLLCKNRHHRRTFANLEAVKRHLLGVHEITTLRAEIMYESSSNVDCFHERTSEWRRRWKTQWNSYSRNYL